MPHQQLMTITVLTEMKEPLGKEQNGQCTIRQFGERHQMVPGCRAAVPLSRQWDCAPPVPYVLVSVIPGCCKKLL